MKQLSSRILTCFVLMAVSSILLPKSFAIDGEWTKKADMPTPRTWLSTSAVNGKIYAIGGHSSLVNLSTVEEYDPTTDKWAKKADMPTARSLLSTSAVNGRIYAMGGLTGDGWLTGAVEEYDPAADKWTKKADMLTARSGLSTFGVDFLAED